MPSSATPADSTPPGRYHVGHYGKSRNFAVHDLYENNRLLAVTLYKKGAETIQCELEARDTVIAEQAARIEQLTAATPPAHESPAPAATRFQDRAWPEANGQFGFFSKAEKERYTAARRGFSKGRS
jgi:hypothetical protein